MKVSEVNTIEKFKKWATERDMDSYNIGREWFAQAADGSVPYRFNTDLNEIESTTLRQY